MGGKKKKNLLEEGVNVAVKGTTAGSISIDGSGWAEKIAKGEGVGLEDFGASSVGGAGLVVANKLMTPEMPKLPEAPDLEAQENAARASAEAKVMGELGTKKAGLSATILGGSVSNDPNALKKKKLLGE